jgi:endonuclease-3
MPKKQAKNTSPVPPPTAEKVQAIMHLLDESYPDVVCSLDFANPLQLLVATILSAQCTDERVNQVTPQLFKKYPSARDFSQVALEELEADIKPTGFYRNKAKSIQACCGILDVQFGGDVPPDLDTLVKLPGVGRKTANVILANAFNIPGVFVDTHVSRVSQRLGLTRNSDPEKIEQDLMLLIPKDRWIRFCHQLIQHGRTICQARKPKTDICTLRSYCDYAESIAAEK